MKKSLLGLAFLLSLGSSITASASIGVQFGHNAGEDAKFKCFEFESGTSYILHIETSESAKTLKSSNQGPAISTKSYITIQLNRRLVDVAYSSAPFVTLSLLDNSGTPNDMLTVGYMSGYKTSEGQKQNERLEISGKYSSNAVLTINVPLTLDASRILSARNPNILLLQCVDIGMVEYPVFPNPALIK